MDLKGFCLAIATETEKVKQYLRKSIPAIADVVVEPEIIDNALLFIFSSGSGREAVITIPMMLSDEVGNTILQSNDRVFRAIPKFMIGRGKVIDFYEFMFLTLASNMSEHIKSAPRTPWIQLIIKSFTNRVQRSITDRFQLFLSNEIISQMPIHETDMKTFAVNHRVNILDPEFEEVKSNPDHLLKYQEKKQKELFPWTFSGLSESALVLNYILQLDLRKYTPFGVKHHNPQRNLFQTLGMKGDEEPILITESTKALNDRGLKRTGYNLMTAFVDIPEVFEDQIIISDKLQHIVGSAEKNYICFGNLKVSVGDMLDYNDVISEEPDKELRFKIRCDSARVTDILPSTTIVNNKLYDVNVVTINTKASLKDGFKFTNRHGNKGIVCIADTGIMLDEPRGQAIPVDIIVSSSSVQRRKNYGQVIEALYTLLHRTDEQHVIPDDTEVSIEFLKEKLESKGYRKDGTCWTVSEFGDLRAVCGWVFWGLIKTPDTQVWADRDTEVINNLGLRTKGIKISTVEMSALITMFGSSSAVIDEILSYQEGIPEVREQLRILDTMRGIPYYLSESLPSIEASEFKELSMETGSFYNPEELAGSVADQEMYPEGCLLQLPIVYQTYVPDNPMEMSVEGTNIMEEVDLSKGKLYQTTKILIPSAKLRAAWQHQSGLMGLSQIGSTINRVVTTCKEFDNSSDACEALVKALTRYFGMVAKKLSTKRGDISKYSLSVRYPNSTKATAALSTKLPPNTIEVHADYAKELGIQTGDLVLVERFPCLGFPSMRVQKVQVTWDNLSRFVIKVSKNSLVSQNLDFDGDVIYVIAMHSAAAKAELNEHFENPPQALNTYINELNNKKQPQRLEFTLYDYGIKCFRPLTPETQAEMASKAVGVKAHTGPVIALCYDLFRISEDRIRWNDTTARASIEVFLDRVGNSVFSQKHGSESMQATCTEAICKADLAKLVELGFNKEQSKNLCTIIKEEAESIGIGNLEEHWRLHVEENRSNLIKTIVRRKHPVYFATRAMLHPVRLLEHLEKCTVPNDLVAKWFKKFTWRSGLYEEYISVATKAA